MGTMKVPRLLFSTSLPIIISMIVQAMYNIVDSIFVAIYDPVAGTGAMTAAFPVQNFMIAVSVGLAVGTNALLSRSLGEKNFDKANVIAGHGFFLNICGYLLFLIFGLFLTGPFVASQVHPSSLTYTYGVEYISIISVFSLGVFIQVVTERLLQATGKSFYSMLTQAGGAIANIILDPIFIFGFGPIPSMGVAGAAIATVIGQFFAALLGIFFNIKFNKEITIRLKNLIPKWKLVKEILEISIPAVFMQAIGSVMTYSMNKILIAFSEDAMNVFGLYFKLQSFVFMPVFGLTNGMVPIVSYNYGAKYKSRVFETVKYSFAASICYMTLGFIVFQLIPVELLGIFNATDSMLEVGVPALRIISISFILASIGIICSSSCQALGKSVYSLIVSIGRQLVALIPCAFLLSLTGQVNNVWWAFPIAEGVSIILAVLFLIRATKRAFGKNNEFIAE